MRIYAYHVNLKIDFGHESWLWKYISSFECHKV